MSIESRLTDLQTVVEQVLSAVTSDNNCEEKTIEDSPSLLINWHAEIRTLDFWKSVLFECVGTLCFTFFVCGVSIPWTGHYPPFLSIAFATALSYFALTHKVFPGAHLNPAFTLALTVVKKISWVRCGLFVTGQSGGAIAGSAILYALTAPGYQGSLGATTVAQHINSIQAIGLELVLTFVLTLTFVSDPTNCYSTSSMLLAATLVGLPCTGAALNPARSLGPAFVMAKWTNHWIFWVGPLGGGILAVYLHTYLLSRRSSRGKHLRRAPSDGESLHYPEIPIPISDAINRNCEPIYGGTRSLYMKPSPSLPRPNLHRSQSVYASKRYDFPPVIKLDDEPPSSATTADRKLGHFEPTQPHFKGDYEHEPVYDRKPMKGGGHSNLTSGPPSYDRNSMKTQSSKHSQVHPANRHLHHHAANSNGHHHSRGNSDSHCHQQQLVREKERENQTNRILAQYNATNGFDSHEFNSKAETVNEVVRSQVKEKRCSDDNYEVVACKEDTEYGLLAQYRHNNTNYSPRLLMPEPDQAYSRILEPLLNSKPQHQPPPYGQQHEMHSPKKHNHRNHVLELHSPQCKMTYSFH